jgi:hypothetical protein
MAKLVWKFYSTPDFVDLTSHVKSFSRFRGKQQYLDNYTGQSMTITIRNDANQAASWIVGNAYRIGTSGGYDYQRYWVSEIQYNDQVGTNTTAGSGSGSTATIYLDDWMARAGKIQLNNFSLYVQNSFRQLWEQFTVASGAISDGMLFGTLYSGSFEATGATYTGTTANRINLNLAGESTGGQIYQSNQYLDLRPGQVSGDPITNAVTLQPTKGSSTGDKYVQYSNFKRITAGQNFLNNITVTPPVVAAQTAADAASVTTYGQRFNGVTTNNNTTVQAKSRAEWLANSQSDPNVLHFEVTYTDVAQDNNGAEEILKQYYSGSFIYLKYVVPGSGTTTTVNCNIEGIRYLATPDQTQFTLYLSPSTLYSEFILDSAVYGVLGQNRLGVSTF